jgi:integrase/recombinase XerD
MTCSAREQSVADASLTPAELVDRFLEHLRIERAASPQTIRAYSADLARYLEWAERTGIDPVGLTHRQMRLYLAEMDRAGYARRTVARRLSAVRSFFAFAVTEGLVASDPSSVLATPKLAARLPNVIPDETLRAMLAAPDPSKPTGLRDRAVLELLYATGARVSEVVGLVVSDLDFGQGQVRLFGKGSKERIVPLYPVALDSVRIYLRDGRPRLARSEAVDRLFLSSRGAPLSADAVRRLFKRSAAAAGAGAGISPHTMRHTFATHMVEAGADLRTVQELLGHVALSSTQIYTHLSMKRLQDVHSKAHPRV